MATNRTNMVMAQLMVALRAHDTDGQTDGQLLKRFVTQQDEAAFAALVRRQSG